MIQAGVAFVNANLTQEIRQLGDQAFLGGKRTPGALPIYDLDGKVSLKCRG